MRRVAALITLVTLCFATACSAAPRTELRQRDAFYGKVVLHRESVRVGEADAVDAFAGLVADAAAQARDAGEDRAVAADLLASVFLPREIKRGPLTFTCFEGPRPAMLPRWLVPRARTGRFSHLRLPGESGRS